MHGQRVIQYSELKNCAVINHINGGLTVHLHRCGLKMKNIGLNQWLRRRNMLDTLISWLGLLVILSLGYAAGAMHMVYLGKCDKVFGGDK